MSTPINRSFNSTFRSLLLIGNILFLLLYIALCYFNRISQDDFYFLSLANEYDPIEATIIERSKWTGRWTSVLLNQIVLSFHGNGLFLFGIGTILLFVFAVHRSLDRYVELGSIEIDRTILWLLSIFIVNAIFFCSVGIDETWFWLCAACTYLIGVVMALIGASTLIAERQTPIDRIIGVIAFIYVGGSSEPFALFIMLILLMLIVRAMVRALPAGMFVLAFASCLIGFAILFSGEGNHTRASYFQDIGIFDAAIWNVKFTAMIIIQKVSWIIPLALLFAMPLIAVLRIKAGSLDISSAVKRIIFILILLLLSVYIFQLPITYATQDIGGDRTLFPITLFMLIASVSIVHAIARAVPMDRRIGLVALVGVILLNVFTLIDQLNVLPEYASAYDERMQILDLEKDRPGTIELQPLPSSGLLFTAEIKTDPDHFSNQHLKAGLGLKAQVIRVE